jgi:DNA-binding NarL/FixJ family response regulator
MQQASKKAVDPQRAEGKSRIIIVDDHPIVRRGLVMVINQDPKLTVVGEAETAADAMRLIRELKPDAAVIDVMLKDTNGIELVKQIKSSWPEMPTLVLSMNDEKLYAERAIRAGALGYVMKQTGTDKLLEAIHVTLKGQVYLSDDLSRRMLGQMVGGAKPATQSPVESLSDRELEVFELIGQGVTTREIAERLKVSIKTIESHREHLKRKLNLANATELLQYAVEWRSRNQGPGE